MSVSLSGADFLEVLRSLDLVDAKQLAKIARTEQKRGRPFRAKSLANYLVERDCLTTYQAERILAGCGAQLILGQYLVLERLGEGGMGEVFKARHRLMKRIVALKTIRPQLLSTRGAVERFRQEIEAASRLSHPNIVLAYDADQVGDTFFLVLEYIEGTDLASLVRKNGPLPVDVACDYILQAALGLQYAHEHGMVHRDIKPHNLLLTRAADGSGNVVKIVDMGLAMFSQERLAKDAKTRITRLGAAVGTLDYMAPEQAADSQQVDIRADIYSLGCTFYFLLAGQPPFAAASAGAKLACHKQLAPPPISKFCDGVPPEIEAILATMMTKSPEERYQRPANVVAAILESAAGIVGSPEVLEPARVQHHLETRVEVTHDTATRMEGETIQRAGLAVEVIADAASGATSPSDGAAKKSSRRFWQQTRTRTALGASAFILLSLVLAAVGINIPSLSRPLEPSTATLTAGPSAIEPVTPTEMIESSVRQEAEHAPPIGKSPYLRFEPIGAVVLAPGEKRLVGIAVHREVCAGEIALEVTDCPADVAATISNIAGDMETTTAEFRIANDAKDGLRTATIIARIGEIRAIQRIDIAITSKPPEPSLRLIVPTEIAVSAGGKGLLKIKVERERISGHVHVWPEPSTKRLTVAELLIAPDKDNGVIEIEAEGQADTAYMLRLFGKIQELQTNVDVKVVVEQPPLSETHNDDVVFGHGYASEVALSLNATRAAVFERTTGVIRVVDTQTVSHRWLSLTSNGPYRVDEKTPCCLAFSVDGRRIVTADGDVRVWNAETGNVISTLATKNWHNVAHCPKQSRVAGCGNGFVKVWDALTGEELLSVKAPSGVLSYLPGGNELCIASDRATIVWDASSGSQVYSLKHPGFTKCQMAFSPTGRYLIRASTTTLSVWDAISREDVPLPHLPIVLPNVTSFAISADGKRLAVNENNEVFGRPACSIKVWDLQSGKEIARWWGRWKTVGSALGSYWVPNRSTKDMAFSADGNWLLAGDAVWYVAKKRGISLDDGVKELTLKAHNGPIKSVVYCGNRIATVSQITDRGELKSEVKLWDVVSGKHLLLLNGPGLYGLSPDGNYIVLGGFSFGGGDMIGVCDTESGRHQMGVFPPVGPINAFMIGPDGRSIFFNEGEVAKTFVFTEKHRPPTVINPPLARSTCGHGRFCVHIDQPDNSSFGIASKPSGHFSRVVFTHRGGLPSPDGSCFAGVGTQTQVFNTKTGALISTLPELSAVTFRRDSKWIAGIVANTAKICDVATGKQLIEFADNAVIEDLTFSPDGKWLVTGNVHGTLRFWNVRLASQIENR